MHRQAKERGIGDASWVRFPIGIGVFGIKDADPKISVAGGAGKHVAEADAAFGDDRQLGVLQVAVTDFVGILDADMEVAVALYDGDVVFHTAGEERIEVIVGRKFRALQSFGMWHVAAAADVGCFMLSGVSECGVAEMVGVHVVVVGAHGGHFAQFVPLRDFFGEPAFAAAGGLNVKYRHELGCLIGARVVVFDLEVASEFPLRPEHHMVGVVFGFGSGGEGHSFGAVGHGADLAVEKPFLFPRAGAVVGEDFLPLGGGGLLEGGAFLGILLLVGSGR